MKSHYTNIIYVVFLLFCLLITSSSAQSLIRQPTDDLSTILQQKNGAQPNSILGEAHYLNKDDLEIYSRDYKGSPSNLVTGMRDRPPMSYSLRMESFNTLLQSNETERYESRPFPVGGYNWSLIVYPNGNRQDSGSGFISLYLAIDNSTLVSSHQEVFADLRFYVFKRTERNFFTVQDTDVWRYNIFKTMWGFPRVLPLDTFRNPSNGYLFNGDNCEFGVDVTVHSPFESSELFTVARNFPNPRFTWTIQRFSTLVGDTHLSNTFSVGGRNWNIQVNPRGRSTGAGRAMSMYLILNANEKVRPNEKIYVRARLRVINQRIFSLLWTTIERPIDHWFTTPGLGWGYDEFISLDDLRDFWKGYVMGDVLIVEVEMEAISSTKYFPKRYVFVFQINEQKRHLSSCISTATQKSLLDIWVSDHSSGIEPVLKATDISIFNSPCKTRGNKNSIYQAQLSFVIFSFPMRLEASSSQYIYKFSLVSVLLTSFTKFLQDDESLQKDHLYCFSLVLSLHHICVCTFLHTSIH
ncbi:unnamed protein product [Brassica rapa subsp. trilocularis]